MLDGIIQELVNGVAIEYKGSELSCSVKIILKKV